MENGHLILAAVGPVQEFIAAGRKVRDIWYGSDCLSELSKSVARVLHQNGCKLIFPAPADPNKDLAPSSGLNVVNRILAASPEGSDPAVLCDKMRAEVTAFWRKNAETARRECNAEQILVEDRFQEQLGDLGEFFAVWTPLNGDYKQARDRVEQLMSARKCARTFSAPTWNGDGLFKSSLDGIRETVLKEGAAKCSRGLIREKEHLDALGFIKRMASFQKADRFDSLIEMAARTSLARLENNPEMAGEYATLESECRGLIKAHLENEISWPEPLYRGRMDAVVGDVKGDPDKHRYALELQAKAGGFVKTYGEPENYLCFLLGDGDHMGIALDGMNSMEDHRKFSAELSRFAGEARKIVKGHDGELIYSGGDDVMAYLPMHTALNCAIAVRNAFVEIMRAACAGRAGQTPTFSAGLVVTHHSESLAEIFAQARAAEKDAKEKGGRDALAVYQNKRQHRGMHLFGKWDGMPARLGKFVKMYTEGKLPGRFGYQLRAVSAQCGETLAWDGAAPRNAAAAELLRVLKRKGLDDASSAELATLLSDYGTIRQLSDELVVARQFAESKARAEGTELNREEE